MSEELKYKVGDEVLVRAKILEADGKTTRYPYLLSTSGWLSEEELNQITVGAPQKPIIPRFMADIIVGLKKNDMTLYDALNIYSFDDDINEIDDWIEKHSDTFARAWLDGYDIEKEKMYTAKLKLTDEYLIYDDNNNDYYFMDGDDVTINKMHSEELLKRFNFWDNPAFEIKEVER